MAGQNLAGPFLPETTRRLVRLHGGDVRFPLKKRQLGLHLDKFTEIYKGDEKEKKDALHEVIQIKGCSELLKNLLARREAVLEVMGACRVEMKTAGPLTLHISRAGAWENAGICLHPVYGFAYLPGSGIKGLVRSWAETVWAQEQENKKEAWNMMDELFGCSPNSESHKFSSRSETSGWRPDGILPKESSAAGRLIFHDAWPKDWPSLEIGISNNHHTGYYGGNGDGPGDWEDPVPVYFLCVRSDIPFEFAISDRRPCGDDALKKASQWLIGALQARGAGAKTSAGYGRFSVAGSPKLSVPITLHSREYELQLVSPAFLAGANQDLEDCDLRGAALRGQLRWWWRAMYAGKIGLKDLQKLEEAIWGSVERGSPMSLSVRRISGGPPQPYTKNEVFLQSHGISSAGGGQKTTTLGLYYTTYGMAEKGDKRWFMPEKSHWQVVSIFRDTWWIESAMKIKITADEVEQQASAALWLLCRYGGIGAKSRKGFGSLEDAQVQGINSWEDCSRLAEELAAKCGIQIAKQEIYGPSLDTALFLDNIRTEWKDPWFASHMIGEVLKASATKSLEKRDCPALGMPRKNADEGRFRVRRHASPVLWSLSRHSDGKLSVHLVAFPSPKLPNANESEEILKDFVEQVKIEIDWRGKKSGSTAASQIIEPESAYTSNRPLAAGDIVEVEILSERTKKGKLQARHIESGWDGHIMDTVPEDVNPGDRVQLYVQAVYAERESVGFKWTASKKSKPRKSQSGRPNHSRGRGRRRR